ncbi:hypothetical protein OAK38_06015 [Verrucomicrobia bacterium]|nr:hypothetical protein [Verrucomicrobiota bacterium]
MHQILYGTMNGGMGSDDLKPEQDSDDILMYDVPVQSGPGTFGQGKTNAFKFNALTASLFRDGKFSPVEPISEKKLNKLLAEANEVQLTKDDVLPVFDEPLPVDGEQARAELVERLLALCERIEFRRKNPLVGLNECHEKFSEMFELRCKQIKSTQRLLDDYLDHEEADLDLASRVDDSLSNWLSVVDPLLKRVEQLKEQVDESGRQLVRSLPKQALEEANEILEQVSALEKQFDRVILVQRQTLKKELDRIKNRKRALALLANINDLAWTPAARAKRLEGIDLPDEITGNPQLMSAFEKLGCKKLCTVSDLAKIVPSNRANSERSAAAKAKAVKRYFRGLLPVGKPGEDYKIASAKESHVKDQTAKEVGDRIYTLVQGRTKFDTAKVLEYLLLKGKVQQMVDQIEMELGHSPTDEEVAREIGLGEEKLWPFR